MPLPPLRTLFLDLDDTILAYGPSGGPTWQKVCAEAGPRLGVDGEQLRQVIAEEADRFWGEPERSRLGRQDMRGSRRVICLEAFRRLDLDPLEAARLADLFHDTREWAMEPLPGAIEALDAFQAQGIPMALLTNGGPELQRAKIERFGLASYFSAIFVEGELGFGKPDPRVFQMAMAALDADPATTWMAGDNLSADVKGSQALGIQGIWVAPAGRPLPHGHDEPDHRVVHLAELKELA